MNTRPSFGMVSPLILGLYEALVEVHSTCCRNYERVHVEASSCLLVLGDDH